MKIEDILKKGAKLTARKLTKKDMMRLKKLMEKAERETTDRKRIDWEQLNKPMTI